MNITPETHETRDGRKILALHLLPDWVWDAEYKLLAVIEGSEGYFTYTPEGIWDSEAPEGDSNTLMDLIPKKQV